MRELAIGGGKIVLEIGDITRVEVGAIVNAANSSLAGGGGVDGAIHRAGGSSIMDELRPMQGEGCPTGQAVVTGAGQLAAGHVIHAVGPRWRGGQRGEEALLQGAYRRSLELAAERGCESVAFPAISCGIYGYPLEDGARVGLACVVEFLRRSEGPIREVRFVLFDSRTGEAFERSLEALS